MKMLYTANGRYIRCCTEEGTRPVIIVCEKEYEVDVQEFMVWSMLSLFLLYVRLAFSFYCQNHISSKLVLAYIIFGYAIVPFYHFCTPIIFSSMGILVVNDSDKESCRIEN